MDLVQREIMIAAPIRQVWVAITDPAHIQAWYAFGGAKVELLKGGIVEHRWDEHGRYLGVIDVLEKPFRFGYQYSNVEDVLPEIGTSTHIQIDLEPISDKQTLVRVTESGIAALTIPIEERASYLEVTTQAWEAGLNTLADHVQRHAMER